MKKNTILEELETYWKERNLPQDGGKNEKLNKAQIGSFSFRYPNLNGKALLLHDINHLITDFPTTWKGEFQVSAWEMASGARKGFPLTLIYPVSLVLIGLIIYPREVLSAYKYGTNKQNAFLIYSQTDIFQMTLEEIKRISNNKDLVCGNRKADGEEI